MRPGIIHVRSWQGFDTLEFSYCEPDGASSALACIMRIRCRRTDALNIYQRQRHLFDSSTLYCFIFRHCAKYFYVFIVSYHIAEFAPGQDFIEESSSLSKSYETSFYEII